VLCTAFLILPFDFVIFWQKNIVAKALHKMLVKLTIVLLKGTAIPKMDAYVVSLKEYLIPKRKRHK
jgi:hypothetical protein